MSRDKEQGDSIFIASITWESNQPHLHYKYKMSIYILLLIDKGNTEYQRGWNEFSDFKLKL